MHMNLFFFLLVNYEMMSNRFYKTDDRLQNSGRFQTLVLGNTFLTFLALQYTAYLLPRLNHFIRPFEKRDVLCYGVWRPSVRP